EISAVSGRQTRNTGRSPATLRFRTTPGRVHSVLELSRELARRPCEGWKSPQDSVVLEPARHRVAAGLRKSQDCQPRPAAEAGLLADNAHPQPRSCLRAERLRFESCLWDRLLASDPRRRSPDSTPHSQERSGFPIVPWL